MLHRGALLVALLVLGCQGHFIEADQPGTTEPPITNAALAFRIGGSGTELISGAASDAGGNLYLAGSFTESSDFDPGIGITALTSFGGSDSFLAKYSGSGALLFVKQIGGAASEAITTLARDAAGNLYVGGSFTGDTDFDPGPGFQVLTSIGGDDGFVAKYSSAGDLLWARRFGGTGGDAVNDVAVDAAGNLYAAGFFAGQAHALPHSSTTIVANGSEADGFLVSFDGSGSLRWALPIGGPAADAAMSVGVAGAAVVVAGTFKNAADFSRNGAPTSLTTQGGTDLFLATYSTDGVLQWVRDIGGTGEESTPEGALALDGLGGIALAGGFAGNADFDAGSGVVARTSVSAQDAFLLRYDAAGSFVSVATIGGAGTVEGSVVLADADGSALLAGAFSGDLDFDPGSGLRSLASLGQAGATDVFVARYSASGTLLWVSRFGEATSQSERNDRATALALDPTGAVLVGGQFFGSPDFDPGNTSFRLISFGAADGFLVKLTAAGALATTP